jgi:hypothetical protein
VRAAERSQFIFCERLPSIILSVFLSVSEAIDD